MAWTVTCGNVRSFPAARLDMAFSSGVQFRGGQCLRSRPVPNPAGRSRPSLQTTAILERFLNFNKPKQGLEDRRNQLKAELLEAIEPLQRGLTADEEDKDAVEQLAQQLEKVNPNPKALASPLINGRWRLLYTTSDSILGTKKPALLRPSGPIYQLIDAENLKAANKETAPLYNQVYADLTPETQSRVAVQFRTFKIGGIIPITAPESAKGKLDTTYLDEDLRISRGDKGNLFVLEMDDRSDRP